jgi:hypothetical protein
VDPNDIPRVYSVFERIFSLPDTRDLAILNAFVAGMIGMIVAKDFLCFVLLLRYSESFVKAAGGTILGGILFVTVSESAPFALYGFSSLRSFP